MLMAQSPMIYFSSLPSGRSRTSRKQGGHALAAGLGLHQLEGGTDGVGGGVGAPPSRQSATPIFTSMVPK